MTLHERRTGNGDPISDGESNGRKITLRRADLQSDEDMKIFYGLLTAPSNRYHLASPPRDTKDLREKLEKDGTEVYFARDQEGRVIGAGGINDAEEGQHDHWLVKVVIDPKHQNRGLGTVVASQLIEKAFTTKDRYGRDRRKISAAVIKGVPGWERMVSVLGKLGFRLVGDLETQVDVPVRSGTVFTMPTQRFELTRSAWEFQREKQVQ